MKFKKQWKKAVKHYGQQSVPLMVQQIRIKLHTKITKIKNEWNKQAEEMKKSGSSVNIFL